TCTHAFCNDLNGRIAYTFLQPCLGSLAPGAHKYLFGGLDPQQGRAVAGNGQKEYDLVYVGNNWCRWPDMSWLFKGLARVRPKLGRVAIFGNWWDGNLPRVAPQTEKFVYSDPGFLRGHGVESYPPVPFGQVETAMGRGRLHPVFVRPVLNTLRFTTLRMFETFTADTVPVLPPYFK